MMRGRRMLRLSWLVLLALGTSGRGRADEPADEKVRAAEFLTKAKQEAASYSFRSGIPGAVFTLHPEPILKWSNPVVGSIYGSVYIWTNHGRPEVITSMFKWYSPFRHQTNEFQSLSLGTFVMERDGQPVWTPSRAGVELEPLPESPAPAGTPAQRLRQMRDLVMRFTASQTDRKLVEREMRLLAQPIYRYEQPEGDLVDGALFVFVLGTDPEALLLIEARQLDGAPRWHYGLARLSNVNLRVSDRGREVWNVPTLPWPKFLDRSEPYTTFRIEPVEAAEKPQSP